MSPGTYTPRLRGVCCHLFSCHVTMQASCGELCIRATSEMIHRETRRYNNRLIGRPIKMVCHPQSTLHSLLCCQASTWCGVQAQNGCTALHNAAGGGHVAVVAELLAAGCDVDIQNSHGNTALHVAASKGEPGCLSCCLHLWTRAAGRYHLNAPYMALSLCAAHGGEGCDTLLNSNSASL